MTAEEVITKLKNVAEFDLDDICNNTELDKSINGIKMLYVEVLEIIQLWDGAKNIGLNYDVESRYLIN